MAMRQAPDINDVPPPPYSETDIYSNSGRHSNPSSNSPRVPSSYGAAGTDDAASRVSSHASSSHSEVIFTPPLTPRTNGTEAGFPPHHDHHHHHHHHHHNPQSQQSSAYSEFAAAYFESRPPSSHSPREQLVHTITVTTTSTPDDVPYNPTWAARDVTQQDWATFTNSLIPHHTAARNEAVINRKLQAEEEALAAAAAASSNGGGGGGSSGSSLSVNGTSHASAQLDQIRADPETDPSAAAAGAGGLRREDVEAVVSQWNEGFFRPRSMVVRLNPEALEQQQQPRIPGAWDRSFDQNVEGPAPLPFPAGHPHPMQMPQHAGPSGTRSWSFAGIRLSEDGISIGDRIVADVNGIRVGNFIADQRGIRFGGGGGGGKNAPRAMQPHYGGPNWHPPAAPGPGPMFGPEPGPGLFPHAPPGIPPGPPPNIFLSAEMGPGGAAGRGRGRLPGRYPSDHRSPSPSSSDADSSDSDSDDSSVGSLPDYDDLYPSQLPLYKQRVTEWLAHPDRLVTRADISQLRAEMRSARSAARTAQSRDADAAAAAAVDEKALKAEIKALSQEWRRLKRQQRVLWKEKRRERRARRRVEKRERREQRRENRRRTQRENWRGGGGGVRQQQHQWPTPWGVPPGFVPPPDAHVAPPLPAMHIPPQPIINVPNSFPWGGGPGRGFGPGAFPGGGMPWGRGGGGGGGMAWGCGPGRGGGGRGGAGVSSEAFNAGVPGSWPAGAPERGPGAGGVTDPSPPPAESPMATSTPPSSQALFRAVEEMEKDIVLKVEELDKVRLEMVATEENAENSAIGGGGGRGRCGGGGGRGRRRGLGLGFGLGLGRGRGWHGLGGAGSQAEGEGRERMAQRLEEEIDGLSRNVEKLRLEADAEFARELAAEERKTSVGW